MRAKQEYRNRPETEVMVLDVLVNRSENGMSVFELRATVSVEIDSLEEALASLKDDGLIVVESPATSTRAMIKPAERVIPDEADLDSDATLLEQLRERFPL
ncbi:DUF6432 family protein [Halobacteria archaeon AArc-curdl1]|uniref:DUF6432 family protein n=1 Tax=Natronosalvus hydrolyticus TaxID=2979988 RepID=A0AAP3E502_9EURY|nr:DUF6432 family protein [Halobacteria archaeon AArc-curdl1]